MNIKPTEISVIDVFNEGRKKLNEKHREGDADKVGILRGGNSGCMVGDIVIGKCHRKSLARLEGIQKPVDEESNNIFDAGYLNEEVWDRNLTIGWDGPIKREEEIPGEWTTSNGVKVTFRPDAVLGKYEGYDEEGDEIFVPKVGLEYKVIVSDSSATGKYYEDRPATENLIQAAHYSYKMGIPFILVYAYHSIAAVPWWAKKRFAIPSHVRKIKPFKLEYKLGWDEGKLFYLTGDGTRVETNITTEGIDEYYALVADMKSDQDLYTLFKNKEYDGKDSPFSMCDYCEFQTACDSTNDYKTWLDKIRLIVENATEEEN